jgi:hypothetical protein
MKFMKTATPVKEPVRTPYVSEITVTEFRELRKGSSLQGFVTFQLPCGMVLHDCTLHRRDDGARWIGLPARQYATADGETRWARIIDFADKQSAARFQQAAMAAVEKFFAADKETEEETF